MVDGVCTVPRDVVILAEKQSIQFEPSANDEGSGGTSGTLTGDRETDEAPRSMIQRFTSHLRQRTIKVLRDADAPLIMIAAVIGSVTALGGIAFVKLMHLVEDLFVRWPSTWWSVGSDTEIPLWLMIVSPVVGAVICGAIVFYGAPEAKGHGVPEVMVALYRQKGRIRARVALLKALASAFTIGSGGSAGAEGPIVQIGSGIGSTLGRVLRINQQHIGVLVGCGAAAGITSVFNAPVAGIFFALEILLRDFSVRTFTPIVIASVFSSAVTRAWYGNTGAMFAVPANLAKYQFTAGELPYYLVLGLVCGVVAVSFTKLLDLAEGFYDRIPLHSLVKPTTGAVALGVLTIPIVFFWRDYFVPAGSVPSYYGNGYAAIRSALSPEFYHQFGGQTVMVVILIASGILKCFGTSLILGSGGSGGIFAPSLFMGAMAGGAFGMVAASLDPLGFGVETPAAYALVGMGAVAAGTTHAPLTGILILFEITGDYKVILPVMLAAVLSTIVAQLILSDSIYTIKVRRAGIRVGRLSDLTVLRRIFVSDVPLMKPVLVHPEESARRLVDLAEYHNAEDFVIVDSSNRYLGMVTGSDMRTTLLQIEALPLLVVDELKRDDIPTTNPDESLDIVMDKFTRSDTSSLPVLSRDEGASGVVVGMISRSRMMRQYHLALERP